MALYITSWCRAYAKGQLQLFTSITDPRKQPSLNRIGGLGETWQEGKTVLHWSIHIFQTHFLLFFIPLWPWCSFTADAYLFLQCYLHYSYQIAELEIIFPCILSNIHHIKKHLKYKIAEFNKIYVLCHVQIFYIMRLFLENWEAVIWVSHRPSG